MITGILIASHLAVGGLGFAYGFKRGKKIADKAAEALAGFKKAAEDVKKTI